jgi:hypothetical protein
LKKLKNKFEKKLDNQLRKANVRYGYEVTRLDYVIRATYIPDWTVYSDAGRVVQIEAKGYLRPEHKRKMVAVKRQNPEADIRIVFYAKNEKNIRWADKHGFKYAVGSIPSDWLV